MVVLVLSIVASDVLVELGVSVGATVPVVALAEDMVALIGVGRSSC